jgi:hypothetical protein
MEQLNRLRLLQESRLDVSDRFMTLEQEKVKLLAAARRIDEEKQRVFQGILLERGLDPHVMVEIEASSGKLKLISEPESETADPPAPSTPEVPQTPLS